MARKPKHPEARHAEIEARLATRNAQIRDKCATPGFGYVALMLRDFGLGATAYHRDTYAECKAIVDQEIHDKSYTRGAIIIQKSYNYQMMLGGASSRVSEQAVDAAINDD